MSKESNGWTPERRRKQAENCRKAKPWVHSTGPQSAEGKKIVADNALKHGMRCEEAVELRKVLYRQRLFIKEVMERLNAEI